MKKWKRRLCGLLCGLLLIPLSAGCQPSRQTQTKEDEGELVLFIDMQWNKMAREALEHFRALYPDVKLTLVTNEWEDHEKYCEFVRSELEQGRGPDVVFLDDSLFPDMYEAMDQGWFLDLNPLIAADSSFSLQEYNQAVLDAGVRKDRRYAMPVTYTLPVLLTSDEALEEMQFDLSDCGTYFDFMEELGAYHAANPQADTPFGGWFSGGRFYDYLSGMLTDRESALQLLDSQEFRRGAQLYKDLIYPYDVPTLKENALPPYPEDLLNGTSLMEDYFGSSTISFFGGAAVLNTQKAPRTYVLPTEEGEYRAAVDTALAINKNSPNVDNAYRFVKLMMSDFQNWDPNDYVIFSVRPRSLKAKVMSCQMYYTRGNSDAENGIRYEKLSGEFCDDFYKKVSNVSECVFLNRAVAEHIEKGLEDYFKGNKSYEQCVEDLKQSLSE